MIDNPRRIAILGPSGFIGSHVFARLETLGHTAVPVRAPRLEASQKQAVAPWGQYDEEVESLVHAFRDVDVVVNCAGNPDASGRSTPSLYGANSVLPGLAAAAASQAGVLRFVHVSSAVVQGARPVLDTSLDVDINSPYGASKVLGERAVLQAPGRVERVVYRPPSVHAPTRRITRAIHKLAQSPLSSVTAPGSQPTPQAHIQNVADAVATLAVTPHTPPSVVLHPYEGWTTGTLLNFFGSGRTPFHIPIMLEPPIRGALHLATRVRILAPNARRLHMLWFGQRQAGSWLTQIGWTPVATELAWASLLQQIDNPPPAQMHRPEENTQQ